MQDVRQAVRGLVRQPGFTATAIVILGLGIGVNTAIFTIFNRFVLQPLPVPHPETIVRLSQVAADRETERLSYPDYLVLRARMTTIRELVASTKEVVGVVVTGAAADAPLPLPARFVSGNYASAFDGRTVIGRSITAGDRADDVAVLGYRFWEQQFDRDPGVIGRALTINGHTFTIVGVMARDFTGLALEPTALWLPIATHPHLTGDPERIRRSEARWIEVSGRLAPDASIEQARAELGTIGDTDASHAARFVVSPGLRPVTLRGGELMFPILLMTATAILLAAACANLAGVLIARWVSRQRELGVRLALGASRRRLIRQLLTESALLACAGGAAGLLLASWIAPIIMRLAAPADAAWLPDVTPDATVFVFSLLVSALASLLFGTLPAWHATRVDPMTTLSRGATLFGQAIARTRMLNGLVSVQVTFAIILLVSATLLVRGMLAVSARDPGFSVDRLLFVETVLATDATASSTTAASTSPAATQVIADQARDAVRRLPGVTSVATASIAPLGASSATLLWRDSQRRPWFEISTNDVSANFFETIGVPLLRGRGFTEGEVRAAAPVVIVNDALARRLWPGADPIGQEIVFPPTYDTRAIVVGVTRDARTANLSDAQPMNLYRPLSLRGRTRVALIVRTDGLPPQTLRAAVDLAVRRVSARIVIDHLDTGAHNVERWIRPARLASTLSTALGVLALLLTIVGMYGVVSFTVTQRTRELAVRMALGAQRHDLLKLVMRQAAIPLVLGTAAGWLGLSCLTPLLRAQLHGISPFDPSSVIVVSIAIVTAALAAIYVPANSAARTDPIANLRRE